MGKKEKSRKGRGNEKTTFKIQQKLERKVMKLEKESGEQSIEEMLDEFKKEQQKLTEVTITNSAPPSPRSHFSFNACPESNELILFGGEYFDGKKITMYSDVFIYDCKATNWQLVQSPTSPPPRSGHQTVYVKTQQLPASLWMFGGEYASPTQLRFHHYKDLWCLRIRTRKWEQIKSASTVGPCARSGHRLLFIRNSLFLFGGFNDTGKKTIYFNDLWQFDLTTLRWLQIKLTGDIPCPRSACLFFPGSDSKSLFLFNGYHKETVARDLDRGVVSTDYFRLNIEKIDSSATSRVIRCSGHRPKPARSSITGVLQSANRVLLFGGVHDVESEDGESVVGYFHNDIYSVDLDKAKWYLFNYAACKKLPELTTDKVESPEHQTTQISSPESQNTKITDGVFSLTLHQNTVNLSDSVPTIDVGACIVPSPRSNPGFAVLGSMLYLYGGVFEVGDRKITLDDFHSLDLNQPISWRCLYGGTQADQEWHGSDLDEDSESDDGDDKSKPRVAYMDVDGDSSDSSSEDDDDEELEEDAPVPDSCETYTAYWARTSKFWFNLVIKGLECEQSTSGSSADPGIIKLAQRFAKDIYNKHSKQ